MLNDSPEFHNFFHPVSKELLITVKRTYDNTIEVHSVFEDFQRVYDAETCKKNTMLFFELCVICQNVVDNLGKITDYIRVR